jgi:hypothetical protein
MVSLLEGWASCGGWLGVVVLGGSDGVRGLVARVIFVVGGGEVAARLTYGRRTNAGPRHDD